MMKDAPLHVLAPIDQDPAALSSLILPLAAAGPLRVTLFHTGDPKVLEEGMKVFRRYGLDATRIAADGSPAREIALLAKSSRSDLIAMLTHGRRGLRRAFMGSVAEEVLRTASVPMLLAHPGQSVGPWRIIVAALDGSARAERALPFAGRLAKAAGTPLYLLRVHRPGGAKETGDYLERTRARLERRGIAALSVARRGDPAGGILRYARDIGASVVCLATHGRTGLKRLVLGSVAEEVVRRSPCPVLAIRA